MGAVRKAEREQRNETLRVAHPRYVPGCPPAGMGGAAGRTTGPTGEHRAALARKAENRSCVRAGPGGCLWFPGKGQQLMDSWWDQASQGAPLPRNTIPTTLAERMPHSHTLGISATGLAL